MKNRVLLVGAAVVILLIGSAAIASNMGFKISIPLAASGANNWVSIPYYNSYTDATSIYTDAVASQVSRWDNTAGALQTWTGRGTNFAVTPGEAYLLKVTTAKNWIVVGSHNPSLAISLVASGANNWVSVPYHKTATDASTLYTEAAASQVSRWDNTAGALQTWTGRGTNFTLTAGEGILMKVTTNKNWTPAHY